MGGADVSVLADNRLLCVAMIVGWNVLYDSTISATGQKAHFGSFFYEGNFH